MAWFQDSQGNNRDVKDPETQHDIALTYYNGEGVTQNYGEAVKWFRLAAEQGHTDAQYNLGFIYENHEGVPLDYNETAKWYRLAADQGHAETQYNLGRMYHRGYGVSCDNGQSIKYWLLAAAQGHSNAKIALQNYPERYRLAANQGYASAQNYLGACRIEKRNHP